MNGLKDLSAYLRPVIWLLISVVLALIALRVLAGFTTEQVANAGVGFVGTGISAVAGTLVKYELDRLSKLTGRETTSTHPRAGAVAGLSVEAQAERVRSASPLFSIIIVVIIAILLPVVSAALATTLLLVTQKWLASASTDIGQTFASLEVPLAQPVTILISGFLIIPLAAYATFRMRPPAWLWFFIGLVATQVVLGMLRVLVGSPGAGLYDSSHQLALDVANVVWPMLGALIGIWWAPVIRRQTNEPVHTQPETAAKAATRSRQPQARAKSGSRRKETR